MNIPRKCRQRGHENEDAINLFNPKECNLQQKWCCTECLGQGIHMHGRKDQLHVKKWTEIIIQKKEEVNKFKKWLKKYSEFCRYNLLNDGLQQCKQIYKILKEYQEFIEKQTYNIRKYKMLLEEIIGDLSEDKFFKLDDQRISELLNFNQNKFVNNLHLLMKPIEHINENVNQLGKLIQDYQESWIKTDLYYEMKNITYSVKLVDKTEKFYNASQISNNEQYLAYGGDHEVLKIYDIKKEKIVLKMNLDQKIYACQFTSDSLQLFVGTYKGYVYGYDVLNFQNLIFDKKIHENQVNNIITINNKYLITYSNGFIIKTEIKTKKQIFELIHIENIVSIDYNDDMIVGGCQKKSIILWDCNSQSIIIHKRLSHPQQVRQIQLINKNQYLLSLDADNNLQKWKIDLVNKDLIKMKEFADQGKIYNFYQIKCGQILYLICKQHIKILDSQGNIINAIVHQAGDFDSWINDVRQVETGRYIQVRSRINLILVTASI